MRRPTRRALAITAYLLFSAVMIVAQEAEASDSSSIDQLFEGAQNDMETKAEDAAALLSTFHSQALTVSASLTAEAGGVVGYSDSTDSTGQSTLAFEATPGLYLVPTFTITARPDESFRFQTTVYGSISSFTPTVSEMFFDYTLLDRVFFRVGKHSFSWGYTRIFGVGDLMSASSSGLAFKANLPLGSGGITGTVLTPSSLTASNFSWRNLTFGAQGDIPLGKSEVILSSTYCNSASTPLSGTAVLKTSVRGVDLFAEGVGGYDPSTYEPYFTALVSGFFWEHGDPDLKLYGEYYFNAADMSYTDHRASVMMKASKLFGGPFDFGFQWAHSFMDGSGIISTGFTVGLWNHIELQFGFPIRYGAVGSFYLVNQLPTVDTTTTVSDILSWNQRYGLMFRVKLSAGF